MSSKTCTKCGQGKDLTDFPRHAGGPEGRAWWCKKCHAEKSRAWRAANPDKAKETQERYRQKVGRDHRRSSLRKKFGIESEDYDRMLAGQGGGCALCGRTTYTARGGHLAVDHTEGTFNIRGLLCHYCNTGLGFFDHDTGRLSAAIEYLTRPPVMVGAKVPQGIHRK